MSTPIVSLIGNRMLELLGTITVLNGFAVDASAAVVSTQGNIAKPYGIVLAQGDADDVSDDRGACPLGKDAYWQTWNLSLVVSISQSDPTPIENHLNHLEAAVRRVLTKDRNWTMGDRVHNYKFDKTRPASFGQASLPARLLPFMTLYHTLRGNPYQQ